jgi:hypothetical protein
VAALADMLSATTAIAAIAAAALNLLKTLTG